MPTAVKSLLRRFADSLAVKLMERFGVALLLVICGVMTVTGRGMVANAWDAGVRHRVQPGLDAASRRVDTLASEIQDVRSELRGIRWSQREFFGAQMDLDPRFRRAVEARVAKRRALMRQRRESEAVFVGLLDDRD